MNPSRFVLGLGLVAGTLLTGAPAHAAAIAPKAYIGLFNDNAVAVFDTGTNAVTKTIPIPTGPHGLAVTPDGRWVYASSDGDSVVSVIDTATDSVTDTIQVGTTPHGLAMTPDGSKVLVAGFGTDSVEAIDTGSNQVVWQVSVPQPHNIAITPDGKTAYAGGQADGNQQLAVIDIASGTETSSVPLDHAPRALNVSPDGQYLAYTLAGVDALQIRDLPTLQLDTQIPVGASPHHPLFTPDDKLGMVVAQGPGSVDLFDPATFTRTGSIKVGTMPHWIGMTSDGSWAYVTNENSNDLSVVNLSDQSVTATVPVGDAPRKIVVQPGPATNVAAMGSMPMSMPTPAAGQSQPAAAPASASAVNATDISIASFAFGPKSLTVKPGQSVTFTNNDSVAHTTTSSAWDSGQIAPGASYTLTAPSTPGTYTYHCSIHPFMTGTLIVE
ncbi:MAG: cupredoxin domain-containing protein [Chloroflexi bacterium]|nr:cupredoxin domain-containing protein [Chloroflexota bacterium]